MLIQKLIKHILIISIIATIAPKPVFANGTCNPATNPHSFACEDKAFAGSLFPLAIMGDPSVAFGDWSLLTYADASGTQGPEFHGVVDAQNPKIPEGIINSLDNTLVGDFVWDANEIYISDWRAEGNTIA